MMLRPRAIPLLLMLAALAACGDGSPPAAPAVDPSLQPGLVGSRDADALFQSDSLTYTLIANDHGYTGEVGVRFTNRTGAAVYFVNCRGGTSLSLQKLVDGEWRSVWSPVLLSCLSPPIMVPPGGVHDMPIHVFSAHPGTNAAPRFSVEQISGVYRAVWHDALRSYQDRLPFGEPIAPEHRVSNRFQLIAPPPAPSPR